MANELSKALRKADKKRGKRLHFEICTVTATGPLLVTLNGVSNVPAESIAGCTYTVGNDAMALYTSPGVPIIIPIT